MRKITCCEEINNINRFDKKYYDKKFRISIGVSNALYYQFDIYASDAEMALETLALYLQNHKALLLYSTYDDLQKDYTQEEIDDNFIYVDGGIYFDSAYISITQQ